MKLAALMEMTDRDGYVAPVEGPDGGGPTDEAHLAEEERRRLQHIDPSRLA